jgi:hypothetical protein
MYYEINESEEWDEDDDGNEVTYQTWELWTNPIG